MQISHQQLSLPCSRLRILYVYTALNARDGVKKRSRSRGEIIVQPLFLADDASEASERVRCNDFLAWLSSFTHGREHEPRKVFFIPYFFEFLGIRADRRFDLYKWEDDWQSRRALRYRTDTVPFGSVSILVEIEREYSFPLTLCSFEPHPIPVGGHLQIVCIAGGAPKFSTSYGTPLRFLVVTNNCKHSDQDGLGRSVRSALRAIFALSVWKRGLRSERRSLRFLSSFRAASGSRGVDALDKSTITAMSRLVDADLRHRGIQRDILFQLQSMGGQMDRWTDGIPRKDLGRPPVQNIARRSP